MIKIISSFAIAALMAFSFSTSAKAFSITKCGLGLLPEGVSCEAPTVGDGNGGIVEIEHVAADTEVADKMDAIRDKLVDRFGYRKAKRIMNRYGDKIQEHLEAKLGEDTPGYTIKTRNGDPSRDSGMGEGRGGDRDPSHDGAGRN